MPEANPPVQAFTIATSQLAKADGKIDVVTVKITRTKPLCVILAYGWHGGKTIMKAANYKKKHLQEKYPTAEINIESVISIADFTAAWTKIYNKTVEKTKGGILRYALYEVHFLGHGAPDQLYLKGQGFPAAMVEKLEVLPWHKEHGILVLHACRTGRLTENEKGEKDPNAKCIAQEFSIYQQTKVIGQMVHATFNTEHTHTIQTGMELIYNREGQLVMQPTFRTFTENVGFKYRDSSLENLIAIDLFREEEVVLWGYKAGSNVDRLYGKDPEYDKLAAMQIWPCQLFINGEKQERVVEVDQFNPLDLEYI